MNRNNKFVQTENTKVCIRYAPNLKVSSGISTCTSLCTHILGMTNFKCRIINSPSPH